MTKTQLTILAVVFATVATLDKFVPETAAYERIFKAAPDPWSEIAALRAKVKALESRCRK